MMTSTRNSVLLISLLSCSLLSLATGQQNFQQPDLGQILFQAFTQSLFPSNNGSLQGLVPGSGTQSETMEASIAPSMDEFLEGSPERSDEGFPDDLLMSASMTPSPEDLLDFSPSPSIEAQAILPVESTFEESPSITLSGNVLSVENEMIESSTPDGVEPSPEESESVIEDFHNLSDGIDAAIEKRIQEESQGSGEDQKESNRTQRSPVDARSTAFEAIRVNCGSYDTNNVYNVDSAAWYNKESLVVSDPFAAPQFPSSNEALLYSTYRYAVEELNYTIPVNGNGVWRVILQWAEISSLHMKEGARVFQVVINGEERDADVDIYRDSSQEYAPLLRSYTVDVTNSSIVVRLIRKQGHPMLSAFQVLFISPNSST